MIPLHARSQVFVSKKELIKIFDLKPSVYTCKLAMLLFGKTLYEKHDHDDCIHHLDAKRLKSLIS